MQKNLFNSVKMTRPNRSTFDLTHDVKLSGKMGDLIPIMCSPVVPGDRFTIGCESLIRFAPMIAPVMHRFDVTMHYFFVPNRLLWENWEKYITNTKLDTTDQLPVHPFIILNADGTNLTKLTDYLGIPNAFGSPEESDEKVNALPFAAYQMIYNEYYRDQNLIEPISFKLTDGDNTTNDALFNLQRRAWEHDYFTSCLPFAQKGEPVDIPLGDVQLKNQWYNDPSLAPRFENEAGNLTQGTVSQVFGAPTKIEIDAASNNLRQAYDPQGTLETQATTINDLRIAMRVQEWLEKAARGGSRLTEFILAQFGVKSSDARLQRPEYITGVKSPVIISEVLNTTGTENAPQGNMSGHAYSVADGKYGNYYSEEYGYIIGIMSVLPKTAYQQGLHRHWLTVNEPTEYYFPSFANLGEEEIKLREIWAYSIQGDTTFGYLPRYAYLRFENNRVAGDFRTSLNFWHAGRIFENQPNLNENFIACNPTTRIFAVEDGNDYLWCQVVNKVTASRLMPKYATPTF